MVESEPELEGGVPGNSPKDRNAGTVIGGNHNMLVKKVGSPSWVKAQGNVEVKEAGTIDRGVGGQEVQDQKGLKQ